MAHGVEGRLPYLDHHVARVAARIPVGLKIRGLTEKHILREAVRPYVPTEVYRATKSVFWAPPVTMRANGPVHTLMQDVLRSPALDAVPFYDAIAVRRLLDSVHLWELLPEWMLVGLSVLLTRVTSACILQDRYRLSA